jgi:hypothetical protein
MIYTSIPKRKPQKPNAKQRELAAEWDALVKKYAPTKKLSGAIVSSLLVSKPFIRETPKIASLNTGDGVASSKPRMQYTGDKMLGIGTLHKSNAVPVFSTDEAKEMARMRRG